MKNHLNRKVIRLGRDVLVLTFLLTFNNLVSFGQLSSVQASFTTQSETIFLEDSTTQLGSKLVIHVLPNDLQDLGYLAVNVYRDEQIAVMDEAVLESEAIQSSSYLVDGLLVIPLIVLDPELSYRVSVSVRNMAGEYLETYNTYYPN